MSLQVEDGGFTIIVNEVLDKLVSAPLLGSEYKVAFFIIRKTWGWKKKEDIISLTQFEQGLGLSRHTVINTIKNLVLKNIIVKRSALGKREISYSFNKYWNTWVVQPTALVQNTMKSSAKEHLKVVKRSAHTKEIQNKTKKREINFFEDTRDIREDPIVREKAEAVKERIRNERGWTK